MQSKQTLTPALSPSERERVNHLLPRKQSLNGHSFEPLQSEGEHIHLLSGHAKP